MLYLKSTLCNMQMTLQSYKENKDQIYFSLWGLMCLESGGTFERSILHKRISQLLSNILAYYFYDFRQREWSKATLLLETKARFRFRMLAGHGFAGHLLMELKSLRVGKRKAFYQIKPGLWHVCYTIKN